MSEKLITSRKLLIGNLRNTVRCRTVVDHFGFAPHVGVLRGDVVYLSSWNSFCSLFASARQLGLGSSQLDQLTDEMFKYDIDFDSDLDENDRFSVVVDQTWKNGQLASTGPVLAATFTVDGQLKSAFRYVREGKPEYFTPDGRSLKRPFIRMPIPYARISSGFGMRKHPILGYSKMHRGVDFAAATGTPIYAAGDGVIADAEKSGSYGNYVRIKHTEKYSTAYAHMSRFAAGIGTVCGASGGDLSTDGRCEGAADEGATSGHVFLSEDKWCSKSFPTRRGCNQRV